jgi:hypothetical protein
MNFDRRAIRCDSPSPGGLVLRPRCRGAGAEEEKCGAGPSGWKHQGNSGKSDERSSMYSRPSQWSRQCWEQCWEQCKGQGDEGKTMWMVIKSTEENRQMKGEAIVRSRLPDKRQNCVSFPWPDKRARNAIQQHRS